MYKYSVIYINILSLIISIITFFFINLFYSQFDSFSLNTSFRAGFFVNPKNQNKLKLDSYKYEKSTGEEYTEDKKQKQNSFLLDKNLQWYLEIPVINLKQEIVEGTTKDTMNKWIGHFEDTSLWNGNVGLAAHNRGYENNYFENLKKLKEGDILFYVYKGSWRKYRVVKHCIIKDDDWTYLYTNSENQITLITCVENEPNYRRCVQANEITYDE